MPPLSVFLTQPVQELGKLHLDPSDIRAKLFQVQMNRPTWAVTRAVFLTRPIGLVSFTRALILLPHGYDNADPWMAPSTRSLQTWSGRSM